MLQTDHVILMPTSQSKANNQQEVLVDVEERCCRRFCFDRRFRQTFSTNVYVSISSADEGRLSDVLLHTFTTDQSDSTRTEDIQDIRKVRHQTHEISDTRDMRQLGKTTDQTFQRLPVGSHLLAMWLDLTRLMVIWWIMCLAHWYFACQFFRSPISANILVEQELSNVVISGLEWDPKNQETRSRMYQIWVYSLS